MLSKCCFSLWIEFSFHLSRSYIHLLTLYLHQSMHYAWQLHLILKDNLGLCHDSVLYCPYRYNEFTHVKGSLQMGVGCCFGHTISICYRMIPFAKIDLLEEGSSARVSTLWAQCSRVCCLTGEEKGIMWLLLRPESQSSGYGLAPFPTENRERREDRVNKSFLLVVRGCSSADLRGALHAHGGMVQCKHKVNPLLKSSASSVINSVRGWSRHCCEMTSFKQLKGSQKRIELIFNCCE